MTLASDDLDLLAIDTIRTLSIDAVQKADSGHPGAPMGMAPMAFSLWTRFLRHAPTEPGWPNRDRFVLSAGHASMLLYSLLHLTGYDLSLDELKQFRQWGSHTPGHPERGLTPGVEATTGPLGQGVANAVGMAIAERRLAHEFNRPGYDLVDHRTYAICSDGDLQEGIASEAASLAGHLKLRKLVMLYDDNGIQLDGPTSMAFSENVLARFEAYGWQTQRVDDGNDVGRDQHGDRAGPRGRPAEPDRRPDPHRLWLAPQAGQPEGARLAPRRGRGPPGQGGLRLGSRPPLLHPGRGARRSSARRCPRARRWSTPGTAEFERYRVDLPDLAAEFERRLAGRLPDGWDAVLPSYAVGEDFATRQVSQAAINALAGPLPGLFGGAADLSESNLTDIKDAANFEADDPGRNLRFGVREHAMGGIANGIAYHGGFHPYCATFLTFSDYMRGSVRLAALAGLPVTYVWTHDSVGLGEDGPTHQPVEQPTALRAIPNLWYVRPGDANEAVAAWRPGDRAARRSGRARTDPPEADDTTRDGGCRPGRRPAGRLHPARVERRTDRDRPDPRGDRLRARPGRAGPRRTRGRRNPDPARQPALLRSVRAAGRGLSRIGPAPGRDSNRVTSRRR